MKLTDTVTIAAPPAKVWEGLNDPNVLKDCIPGCESLEKTSDTGFEATAGVKIGPLKASFKGKVTLSDLDPPNSYTISGEGMGGPAGFAKGQAKVSLAPNGEGTDLTYEVDASVGGKLAQIGQRFIDQTAKKLSDEFFAKFAARVAETPASADDITPDAAPVASAEAAAFDRPAAPRMKTPVPPPERPAIGTGGSFSMRHKIVLAGLLVGFGLIAAGILSIIYG